MKHALALLALSLALSACTTAQLDLPVNAVPVTGANPRRWNAPIAFGEWRTEAVNEGTHRSFLADLGIIDIGKADEAYRLTINGVAVECHTRDLVVGGAGVFVDPSLGKSPLLVCGYRRASGTRSVLSLTRTGAVEPTLRGELRELGGPSLQVRSLHRAKGSRFPSSEPFGFEILSGDEPVAIVETINQGRVWIDPQAVANRDTLAAAAASLLLFRDPDARE
jgi:hypothetical protein